MAKTSNSNFTRGAQLWAHNVRMALQGVKNVCLFGIVLVLVLFVVRICQYMTMQTVYYFAIERWAGFKLELANILVAKNPVGIEFYSIDKGYWVSKSAKQYIYQFWHQTIYGDHIKNYVSWIMRDALFEAIATFCLGVIIGFLLFVYRGKNILGVKKLRGSEIVRVAQLRRRLKLTRKASKIQISGLPLVKDSETQHFLVTGTTGAGKTNMLNELLPQIRLQKQRAVIFDVTGEFVDRFYNPKTDLILNPLQENSVNWLPWNDCHTDEEFNNLAAAFVDGESIKSDRYWEDAARSVLTQALKKEAPSKNIENMLRVINRAELRDFCQYFADTDAAGYVTKEAEKGAASVRSTLISKIERLKILKDKGDFSIKEWINGKEDGGWLFISSTPNDLDTTKQLISAWANIAIKGILDRPHSGKNPNMWFILDELPALQKIPSLSTVLAQGRKYGACVVAGIQNIAQLDRIYGKSAAQELLDLYRTKFFFAVSDNNIAEYASKSLGEAKIDETKESLSYGSNTMRDGVNINSSEKIERLVLPDEIKNLDPRTCFVKLCGNYPITKLEVKLQSQNRFLFLMYKILKRRIDE